MPLDKFSFSVSRQNFRGFLLGWQFQQPLALGGANMIEAPVNIGFVRGLRHLAPANEIRHYLCGVCVQFRDDGIYYVATNGHALVAIRDDKAEVPEVLVGRDVIVPKKHLDHMPKTQVDAKATFLFETTAGSFEVRVNTPGQDDWIFFPIDGRFPDWKKQALPKSDPSDEPAHFQAETVAKIVAAHSETIGGRTLGFRQNGNNVAFFLSPTDDRFVALIMPFRLNAVVPAWCKTRPAPNE